MLYRGMRLERHVAMDGRIRPIGTQTEVIPLLDGSWSLDGRMTLSLSENNAARAHHIQTGKWGGCFVSTSRSRDMAEFFATNDGAGRRCEGVIYHIDESLFDEFGVVSKEFDDPLHPSQMEVSIRAADGGEIPIQVVVKVEAVRPPSECIQEN